jgi:hypothetical protein
MAYARTTVTQLRSILTERLGGQATFYTQTEIDQALNESLSVWQLLTGEYTAEYSQELAAGSDVITVDTTAGNLGGVIRIRSNVGTATTGAALYPESLFEMDQEIWARQAYGAASSGTPVSWAPLGYDSFVVHPPASTTQTVGIMYMKGDVRLSLDGTTNLDLGDEEIQKIVEYAHWFLAFKEGLDEAFKNVSPLKDMFLIAARLRNQKLRNTAPFRDYMAMDRAESQPDREIKEQEGMKK